MSTPGPAEREQEMRALWEASFAEQVAEGAYNLAPVEALVRSISYYLRAAPPGQDPGGLHFCELGCGAGPNLLWLAQKGIRVSGVDIAPTAIELTRRTLDGAGHGGRVENLLEASVSRVPLPDASLEGVLEACVFQHLAREDREAAFAEVDRLTKPGGLFVGYMLEAGHTVFDAHRAEQDAEDFRTLNLNDGRSRFYLTNIGLTHFFTAEEVRGLLPGWSVVDPCLTTYELPRAEARRRGYDHYLQSMLTVYAVK